MKITRPQIEKLLLSILALILSYFSAGCIRESIDLCIATSFLGSEYFFIVVGLALYNLTGRDRGLRIIIALLLVASTTGLLKVVVNSPRPPASEWLVHASGPGFPSGHAAITTSFWIILFLETSSLVALAIGVVHIAGVVASRVILRVHYPVDVVGGVAVGLVLSYLYWLVSRKTGARVKEELYTALLCTILASTSLVLESEYISLWMLLGLSIGVLLGLLTVSRRVESIRSWQISHGIIGFISASIFIVVLLLLQTPYYLLIGSAMLGYIGIVAAPLLEKQVQAKISRT